MEEIEVRKLVYILAFAVLALATSCAEEPASLNISGKKQSVVTSGGTLSATITANNPWTASCNSSWVKLTPASGQAGTSTLSITVEASTETEERTASILVSSSTLRDTITIVQEKKKAIILDETVYEIPYGATEITINVKYNVDIEYEIKEGSSWLSSGTKALSSKDYVFNAAENPGGEARIGYIVFKDKRTSLSETATIVQDAAPANYLVFEHSLKNLKVPQIGGDEVTGSIDWGDNKQSEWSTGASHSYTDKKAAHTVSVELYGNKEVTFSNLNGVNSISLGKF